MAIEVVKPKTAPVDGEPETEKEFQESFDEIFGLRSSSSDDDEDDADSEEAEEKKVEDEDDTDEADSDDEEKDTDVEEEEEDSEQEEKPKKKAEDEDEDDEDEDDDDEEEEEVAPKKDAKAELELTLLRLQLKEMQRKLEEKDKVEAPKEEKKEEKPAKDAIPTYGMQVPDEMMQLLDPDQPEVFKKGIEAMLNGAATVIHNVILEQIKTLIPDYINKDVPKVLQQREQVVQQQTAIRQDFFKHYPGYDDPAFEEILPIVAQEIAVKFNPKEFTPEIREAIAFRMKELTGKDGKVDSTDSSGRRRRNKKRQKTGPQGAGRKKMVRTAARSSSSGSTEIDPVAADIEEMFGPVKLTKGR